MKHQGDTGTPGIANGAIYCRLSLARYGDTTKVEDQERICRDLSGRLGWQIATGIGHPEPNGVYVDNNRSAWQRNRKRPAWDQMLRDVGAGRIGAIVVYHGDRLVRRPEDLADLIKLADSKGIRLASPTGTHDLDSQRLELWIRAAFAEEESTRNSERKKAGFERMRRDGKVPVPGGRGGRAFGYEADGITPHPAEAAFVQATARRLLRGATLADSCRRAAAAGLTSTTGQPLTYKTLKRILLRPRTAALLPDGSAGTWEPVITPGVQRRLAQLFAAQPPKESPGGRYLLSGIAVCWACEHPVQRTTNYSKPAYGCVTPGCRKAHRNMDHLDAYLTGLIVAHLGSPAVMQAARRSDADLDGRIAMQIAALEAGRDDALEALGSLADNPGASAAMLARSVAEFDKRISLLRASTAGPRAMILGEYAGITRAQFEGLPLQMRRRLIRAAFRVTILAASKRGPGFRTQDVDVALRED